MKVTLYLGSLVAIAAVAVFAFWFVSPQYRDASESFSGSLSHQNNRPAVGDAMASYAAIASRSQGFVQGQPMASDDGFIKSAATAAGTYFYWDDGESGCWFGISWPDGSWSLGMPASPDPCPDNPDKDWFKAQLENLLRQFPDLKDVNFVARILKRYGYDISREIAELLSIIP